MNTGGLIEGGHVGGLGNGDWLAFNNVDFGNTTPMQVHTLAAGGSSGSGLVRFRLDSPTGPLLGDFAIADTGGWNSYRSIPATTPGTATGVHTLYITFESGYPGDYVNIDRFAFQKQGTPIPDLSNSAAAVQQSVVASGGANSSTETRGTNCRTFAVKVHKKTHTSTQCTVGSWTKSAVKHAKAAAVRAARQ